MVRATRVAVVSSTVVAFVACFSKPDAPGGGGGPSGDGGPGPDVPLHDGPAVTDAPGACTVPRDDFETGSATCGGWGTYFGSGVMRGGGVLRAMPPNGSPSGCRTSTALPLEHGVSIKVIEALTALNQRTFLSLEGVDVGVEIRHASGQVILFSVCAGGEINHGQHEVAQQPYLRLRGRGVGSNSSAIDIETGGNGDDWSLRRTCMLPGIQLAPRVVSFGAEALPSGSMGSAAVFDDFNMHCN